MSSEIRLTDAVPEWWSESLYSTSVREAREALPHETCGMFVRRASTGDVELMVFSGVASSSEILADAHEIVDFAYSVLEAGGQVVATFHTHPMGQLRFSAADEKLSSWADQHVLLALRQPAKWVLLWGESNR